MGTSANKMVYPESTFLQWGLFIPSFKTIAYVVCNRFNTSFCARYHKKNRLYQTQIEGFETNQHNKSNLLWQISVLSIYVDTYYALYAIIVTECDVLSNEIFFLTSQKGGGIASVNYLKVRIIVTYLNTFAPDRNQIHALLKILLLSS